ncbi:ankyrin repeat domain-containing protein [Candidatus Poribacteria bacterium]|nr:ankyrin repeat domain-containing protein [Candidatus Poribacteria bacterium]
MRKQKSINEALIQAAKDGDFDEVRRLVEQGADVNYSDIPPFLWTYFRGHTDLCKYLLNKGGNINYDGFEEMTLLMAATVRGDVEFASFLIDAGADVNLPLPAGGETALHKAAVRNQPETMKLLIQRGGDVNRQTKVGGTTAMDFFGKVWGETPLHIAAVAADEKVIKVLLDAGADKTARNAKGETPFDLARQHKRPKEILELLVAQAVELAQAFGEKIQEVYPSFQTDAFVAGVRARMKNPPFHRISEFREAEVMGAELREHLPPDYSEALEILMTYLDRDRTSEKDAGLNWGAISHFVGRYGLEHFDESMQAFYKLAKRNCVIRWSVREFVRRYPERALALFHQWVKDESPRVRVLVCDATAPRMAFDKSLKMFIEDPRPVLELLEPLKNDPLARGGVAYNLYYMLKDNPDAAYETLERWQKDAGDETQEIIRHALHYQVKMGDPRALALLGYYKPEVTLSDLKLERDTLRVREVFNFSFRLQSETDTPQNLQIDYAIHFKTARGRIRRKLYRLSKRRLKGRQKVDYQRRHFPLPSLKPFHEGKLHDGWHRLEIQVNGKVLDEVDFQVKL